MKNVLFISCGSLTATEVNFALRASDEYRLYGSSTYMNHGAFVYKNYISDLPNMSDDTFIDRLNEIIKKYDIRFILSGHESMILFLQEHRNEIHATIVSSCYETALLCRYKSKTYEALREFDFVPKVYTADEVREFPVFVKKDDDQGARHAYRVDDAKQLAHCVAQENMIICEYLPGEEVTVDCFTDKHGKLRFCNPRVADRMLAGIDVHARRLLHCDQILDIAEKINSKVNFRGQWFFQVRQDKNGKYKLLEMSTRFAGAFALTLGMDINLPLLALRDFDDKEIEISYNDLPIEADKQFFTRFDTPIDYDTVYLDGIDVFSFHGHVDRYLMMFIYQCVEQGKKLVLVTHEPEKSLARLEELKISSALIDECTSEIDDFDMTSGSVLISRNENKRKLYREAKNSVCFAPSAIGTLLDWRG